MAVKTTMVHVRVEEELKQSASTVLANFGLNISDAVRILLTRVTKEGSLPIGLTADEEAYDAWFRDKVLSALSSTEPKLDHDDFMKTIAAKIEK